MPLPRRDFVAVCRSLCHIAVPSVEKAEAARGPSNGTRALQQLLPLLRPAGCATVRRPFRLIVASLDAASVPSLRPNVNPPSLAQLVPEQTTCSFPLAVGSLLPPLASACAVISPSTRVVTNGTGDFPICSLGWGFARAPTADKGKISFREIVLPSKNISSMKPKRDLMSENLAKASLINENSLLPCFEFDQSCLNELCKPWEDALIVNLLGKKFRTLVCLRDFAVFGNH